MPAWWSRAKHERELTSGQLDLFAAGVAGGEDDGGDTGEPDAAA